MRPHNVILEKARIQAGHIARNPDILSICKQKRRSLDGRAGVSP